MKGKKALCRFKQAATDGLLLRVTFQSDKCQMDIVAHIRYGKSGSLPTIACKSLSWWDFETMVLTIIISVFRQFNMKQQFTMFIAIKT